MSKQLNDFISKFVQFEIERGLPKKSVEKLPKLLRIIIEEEMPKRDKFSHVYVRDLSNSTNLPCTVVTDEVWCLPVKDKYLMAGVVFPYWRHGFKSICKDENLKDTISWFFHFASQYIARSRVVDVIGAIALAYNQACDFRGETCRLYSINEFKAFTIDSIRKECGVDKLNQDKCNNRGKRFINYFNLFNSLDPFINRMVFNYTRAINLFKNGFEEEAITALDNTVNVAEQYVRERLQRSDKDQRALTCFILGMTRSEVNSLKQLYNLRCCFGAHPSFTKWWDFFEIYEDHFEEFFKVVKKIVINTCRMEQVNRVVDKKPKSWSQWLNSNLLMLWEAVSFQKIP